MHGKSANFSAGVRKYWFNVFSVSFTSQVASRGCVCLTYLLFLLYYMEFIKIFYKFFNLFFKDSYLVMYLF